MSQNNCIKNILNIQDENLVMLEKIEDVYTKKGTFKRFYGYLKPDKVSTCPHCKSKNIVRNGWKESIIQFLDIQGIGVQLVLKKNRFLCKDCKKSFMQKASFVRAYSTLSHALIRSIIFYVKKKISLKDIADIHRVSVATVQRVIDNYYACYTAYKVFKSLPEVLCFDEFKSTKDANGAMSFIYMNGQTKEIIDIVEDRRLDSLKDYFANFTQEARNKVKFIVIDMYSPYMSLAEKLFPKATIIIDRFHLVQHINKAMNSSRIKIMNSFKKTNPFVYRSLKRDWKVILTDEVKISYEPSYRPAFKAKLSSKDILEFLLKQDKTLEKDYIVYQWVLAGIQRNNYQYFEDLFEEGYAGMSAHMKKAIMTFKRLKEPIEKTLSVNYNNGCIEGKNNLIKVIKRIAFGYRRFANLRKRTLIIAGVIPISNTLLESLCN